MEYSIDTTKYIDRMVSLCARFGVYINLKEPKTIQDKIAWLNIYEPNRLKCKCADKIKLHEYCKEVLGKDICIPIIKVWDKADDIDFDSLPDKFVLKCNHGSGMNIIVTDKSSLNRRSAVNSLNSWMKDDFTFRNGFEAHYHDIERKVFAEEYEGDGKVSPDDYKFLCFNGEPKFVQVFGDRYGKDRHLNYYDTDFNKLSMYRVDFTHRPDIDDKKPEHLDTMLEYARKLSAPFKFVRVDLYEINGEVCLGELTFTPGAMLFKYKKPEDEIKVGNMVKL